MARVKYPETSLLTKVGGVDTLIALTFVLTVEDKNRFEHSRDVGCYVGLKPRQGDSGESQPQLRITKEGDAYLEPVPSELGRKLAWRFRFSDVEHKWHILFE